MKARKYCPQAGTQERSGQFHIVPFVMGKHSPRSAIRASFDFGEPYSRSSSSSIAVVFIIFSPRSLIIRNYPVKIKRFQKNSAKTPCSFCAFSGENTPPY